LAAVLAADAELEVVLRAPAALDGDPHQVADALLVENLERVALAHAVLEVARQELALGVVARKAQGSLGEVVGAEREEVGLLGDLVCADAGAWELDNSPDEIFQLYILGRDGHGQLAEPAQLLAGGD